MSGNYGLMNILSAIALVVVAGVTAPLARETIAAAIRHLWITRGVAQKKRNLVSRKRERLGFLVDFIVNIKK